MRAYERARVGGALHYVRQRRQRRVRATRCGVPRGAFAAPRYDAAPLRYLLRRCRLLNYACRPGRSCCSASTSPLPRFARRSTTSIRRLCRRVAFMFATLSFFFCANDTPRYAIYDNIVMLRRRCLLRRFTLPRYYAADAVDMMDDAVASRAVKRRGRDVMICRGSSGIST